MITCLFGLLPAALRFTGFTHLLEERGERRVGLSGGVFSDLHRLALGRGGGLAGFADGWFSVSLRHRLADTLLLIGGQARGLGATGGGLLAIAFALARGFTAGLGFWLTVTFFASASRLGVRLAVAAFGAARLLTAGLGLWLAAGLVGLTLFHGLTDLFKNRGDGGVGFTGGFIGDLAGFLLMNSAASVRRWPRPMKTRPSVKLAKQRPPPSARPLSAQATGFAETLPALRSLAD